MLSRLNLALYEYEGNANPNSLLELSDIFT